MVKKRNFLPQNRSMIFPIWSKSKPFWDQYSGGKKVCPTSIGKHYFACFGVESFFFWPLYVLCWFVRAMLFTTLVVQDYLVHHWPALCTIDLRCAPWLCIRGIYVREKERSPRYFSFLVVHMENVCYRHFLSCKVQWHQTYTVGAQGHGHTA